ncbi:MAG: DUF72 domain-containing protein [Methanolinea sp.]|nr:DUF72 domain-containing protein [Methanolinea sp.]
MEVFVGTSGWSYDWNEGGNLDWYIQHAGLNAVELNASFYRFPFRNQILGWSRKGRGLAWAVKVHRGITHTHRFNEAASELWKRFHEAFIPLDPLTDFYLFQAHPRFADTGILRRFAESCGLGPRFALEIRNPELLKNDPLCRGLQEYVTLVSVDSPVVRNRIFPGERIYLRMHGRRDWYSHYYTDDELHETAHAIRDTSPEIVYVFFNNDHAMLENGRRMMSILSHY